MYWLNKHIHVSALWLMCDAEHIMIMSSLRMYLAQLWHRSKHSAPLHMFSITFIQIITSTTSVKTYRVNISFQINSTHYLTAVCYINSSSITLSLLVEQDIFWISRIHLLVVWFDIFQLVYFKTTASCRTIVKWKTSSNYVHCTIYFVISRIPPEYYFWIKLMPGSNY